MGIYWDLKGDNFRFCVNPKTQPATRSGILSTVASLFDPPGFLALVLLTGKPILQETCRNDMSWDDPLPDILLPRWERWKADLAKLEKIKVPCCIVADGFGKFTKREIHHFSDSTVAPGDMASAHISESRMKKVMSIVHCSWPNPK